MLELFHFIRPVWLLAVIPVIGFWLLQRRRQDPARSYRDLIAPHLLGHLLITAERTPRLTPLTLMLPLSILICLALAGPTWDQEPSPFAEEQAGLMLLMKVHPGMEAADVQPSRLERSKHKIHDLLSLRQGGAVGLIAYSGSAHLVMPLTKDGDIIEQMATSLEPALMPVEGDALAAALTLAEAQFTRNGKTGSVLVMTDSVSESQYTLLEEYRQAEGPPVQFLATLGTAQALAESGISDAAERLKSPVQLLTVDDADLRRTISRSESMIAAASIGDDAIQWRDQGYRLLPLIAVGLLFWGRKGFSIRWV